MRLQVVLIICATKSAVTSREVAAFFVPSGRGLVVPHRRPVSQNQISSFPILAVQLFLVVPQTGSKIMVNASTETQIDLVVGRKLQSVDKIVSYYNWKTFEWTAKRCDTDIAITDKNREVALLKASETKDTRSLRTGKPQFSCRLETETQNFLSALAKQSGMKKADYVSLLILKAFAAELRFGAYRAKAGVPELEYSDASLIRLATMRKQGLVKDTDEIGKLLELEAEGERKLVEKSDDYLSVAPLQAQQLRQIDKIFRMTPPRCGYKVRIELECKNCIHPTTYKHLFLLAEDRETTRDWLREHQGHDTFVWDRTIDNWGVSVTRCHECGYISGRAGHDSYNWCEEHLRDGKFLTMEAS